MFGKLKLEDDEEATTKEVVWKLEILDVFSFNSTLIF